MRTDLPRRRGAGRRRRPDLRRERSRRRHPPGGRLRDPAHRAHRPEADGAGAGRLPTAAADLGLGIGARRRPVEGRRRAAARAARPRRPPPRAVPRRRARLVPRPRGGAARWPTSAERAVGRTPASTSATAAATGSCGGALDPLGLVLKGGAWYLVAGAGRPAGVRTFRVSRVESVRRARRGGVTGPTASTSPRTWADVGRSFERDLRRYVVQAGRRRPAVAAAPRPARAVGHGGRRQRRPAGRRRLVPRDVHSRDLEVAHDELLRVGAALEVLAPPELRAGSPPPAGPLAARHADPAPGDER